MVMKHPKNPGGTTPKSQKPITPHRRNPSHAAIAPSRVLRYTFPWSHRVFLSISACCGARFASFEVSSWGEGAGNATIDRICICLHRTMVASCRNLGRGVAHLNCQLMKGKGVGKSRFIPGRGHFAKGKSSRWRCKETVVATTHNPHRYIFCKTNFNFAFSALIIPLAVRGTRTNPTPEHWLQSSQPADFIRGETDKRPSWPQTMAQTCENRASPPSHPAVHSSHLAPDLSPPPPGQGQPSQR